MVDRFLEGGGIEDEAVSQPYLVASMTEEARIDARSRVLEIGTGSGYQAAVLAEITPHVSTIEIKEKRARRADGGLLGLGPPEAVLRFLALGAVAAAVLPFFLGPVLEPSARAVPWALAWSGCASVIAAAAAPHFSSTLSLAASAGLASLLYFGVAFAPLRAAAAPSPGVGTRHDG
jgi:hypothetical protein